MEDKKDKNTKFKESTYEKNIEGDPWDVDVLEQVQKMDDYDKLIAQVPEEDHDKLFEAVQGVADDWQVLADMIQSIYKSPEAQELFKKQAAEKFGNN